MGSRDPRVDAYIAKQKEFAKPILTHLRDVVHDACPDVEETLKWSVPHFDYKGQMMCRMAAFKESSANGGTAAGNLGRLTSVTDVPSRKPLTEKA